MKLDETSNYLCRFSTPFGFYRFLRLPFGLSCAPEEFQKRNLECFGDIKDVFIYFNDLLIATSDEHKHDLIVEKVLKSARELNVKFNIKKMMHKERSNI